MTQQLQDVQKFAKQRVVKAETLARFLGRVNDKRS